MRESEQVEWKENVADTEDVVATLSAFANAFVPPLCFREQSCVAFDKADRTTPSALKYSPRALHEAMVNALAHRNFEMADPTRITVFSDRVEVVSPGSLPSGVSPEELTQGTAPPKWRNQCLACFVNRLQLAQADRSKARSREGASVDSGGYLVGPVRVRAGGGSCPPCP